MLRLRQSQLREPGTPITSRLQNLCDYNIRSIFKASTNLRTGIPTTKFRNQSGGFEEATSPDRITLLGSRLRGKSVAMVTFSPYPGDPRPRRAAEAFIKGGMSVDVICVRDEKDRRHEVVNGVDITRLPIMNRRGSKLSYACQYSTFILLSSLILGLRSLHRRYDLVHVHNMPDILILSALLPKVLGAKVILDLHDPMPELMMTIFNLEKNNFGVRLITGLEKWSIARADLVITVNLACKSIFSSRSCRPEKIQVVMNSPDGEIFPFRSARSQRSEPKRSNDRFVIMYHGSLFERNGLDLAIDAMVRIRESVPSAELRIYGRATPYLERVMEMARSKQVSEAVRYLGPKLPDDLASEIDHCDVGIIPNPRNAFTQINTPTRIFEYLALGKPVIAPRTPGIEDYFSPDSLIFFEPGDSENLAKRIEYVFCHPVETLEAVKRGQQVYLAHAWSEERRDLVSSISRLLDTNTQN
jgi:glycosyltransferase involved in cell wall biosynthesis